MALGQIPVEPASLRFISDGEATRGGPDGGRMPPISGTWSPWAGLTRGVHLAIWGLLRVIAGRRSIAEVGKTAPLTGDLCTDAAYLVEERVDLTENVASKAIQSVDESCQVRSAVSNPALANLDREQESSINALLRCRDTDQSASWAIGQRLRQDNDPLGGTGRSVQTSHHTRPARRDTYQTRLPRPAICLAQEHRAADAPESPMLATVDGPAGWTYNPASSLRHPASCRIERGSLPRRRISVEA